MLIVASLVLAAAAAQEPAFTPDVRAAERAFADALQRHDRAAFERVIAPDAIFYLPTVLEGRDAITMGWIPFLAVNGSMLNIEPGSVSGQGDLLMTEGRYSIAGTGPIRPVQGGRYLAVWKRGTEGWTLYSFAGGAPPPPRPTIGAPPPPRVAGGVGDYRFGMTKPQVRQIPACEPYLDVPSTGGLECPNFTFESRKMNVSFVFANNGLRLVQLW
jgi:ketosteroid isomerase-like protein